MEIVQDRPPRSLKRSAWVAIGLGLFPWAYLGFALGLGLITHGTKEFRDDGIGHTLGFLAILMMPCAGFFSAIGLLIALFLGLRWLLRRDGPSLWLILFAFLVNVPAIVGLVLIWPAMWGHR